MAQTWSAQPHAGAHPAHARPIALPAAQLELLVSVTLEETREALGLARTSWLWPLAARALRPGAWRFARRIAAYDRLAGLRGLRAASVWALEGLVGRLEVQGRQNVPPEGPLLVAANHPGLADSLALFASLPREDLRVLAAERPFLAALPHTSRHMLYLPEGPSRRSAALGVVRETGAHLRRGGAVLLYPGGGIEPDPAVLPGAAEALERWSDSLGLLARLAPDTRVVPALISGVLSPTAQRLPLTRLRRAARDRERLGAMLQVALPILQRVTVRVVYGAPLSPDELRRDGDSATAITRVVVERMQALIRRGG